MCLPPGSLARGSSAPTAGWASANRPLWPTPARSCPRRGPVVGGSHGCTRAGSHPTGASPKGFGCQGWGSCLRGHHCERMTSAAGYEGRCVPGLGGCRQRLCWCSDLRRSVGELKGCRCFSPRRRGRSPRLAAALGCWFQTACPAGVSEP